MTRTERNQYPAALLKDRHSRSGLNKNEDQRKQGGGAHNWGSFRQEGEYESQADMDAAQDRTAQADGEAADGEGDGEMFEMENEVGDLPGKNQAKVNGNASTGEAGSDGEDAAGAGANKDLMRDAIATSPADSMASFGSNGNDKNGMPIKGRRMSNVSDEERERARVYREGVMGNGGPVSLANIARTSFGVASPPNGNAFGTSPTKYKAGA